MRVLSALTSSSKNPATLGPLRLIISVPCALLIFKELLQESSWEHRKLKIAFLLIQERKQAEFKVCSCQHRAADLQYFRPVLHEELTDCSTDTRVLVVKANGQIKFKSLPSHSLQNGVWFLAVLLLTLQKMILSAAAT